MRLLFVILLLFQGCIYPKVRYVYVQPGQKVVVVSPSVDGGTMDFEITAPTYKQLEEAYNQ